MERNYNNEKLRFNISCCLILLVVVFLIVSLINDSFSRAMSTAWDGTTVASNFAGGNGSSDSPYLISNGAELAFFKSVIEDNNNVYGSLYYQLADDIDMGSHDFATITNKFKGHFDGRGYSINNVKFTKSTIDDVDYYGLFAYVADGSITNMTINNVSISTETSTFSVVTGIVAGKVLPENNSVINNIAVTNATLNLSNSEENEDSIFGGMVGLIGYNTDFGNIYEDISITTSFSTNVGSLASTINSDPGVTITKTTVVTEEQIEIATFSNSSDVVNMDNQFIIKNDNKIYLNDQEVDNTDSYKVITDLLCVNNEEYIWEYLNGKFVLSYKPVTSSVTFSFESDVFTPTASTIDTANRKVVINDLEADYNYLQGLNYTEPRTTALPSGTSTGYYDLENLVAVQLTYDGADINDNRLIGEVSPISNENSNKYVYYKYYPLERNTNGSLATDSQGRNYIKIELIDNPFSKRPDVNNIEYAFNGWVCNQNNESSANICANSTFSFKKSNYTRFMQIPVTGGTDIKVYLNASWKPANVVTDEDDLTDFYDMSMRPATHTEYMIETQTGANRWRNDYDTLVYERSITRGGGQANYNHLLPYDSWYKTSQNGTTYTHVTGYNTYCSRNTTCYIYNLEEDTITAGDRYNNEDLIIVTQQNNNTATGVHITGFNNTYMYYDANYEYTIETPIEMLDLADNSTAGGYFYKVSNPTTAMVNTGTYYNSDGTVCTNANNCRTAYKLIHYNDSVTNTDGTSIYNIHYGTDNPNTPANEHVAIDMDNYYYLVTRDTNIFRYTSGTSLDADDIEVNRPFTLTGTSSTGTTASGVLSLQNSLTAANDLVIENIRIYGPGTAGNDNIAIGGGGTNYAIYANSHNLKIGRNTTNSRGNNDPTYLTSNRIYGGTTTNVSGTFRVIVESGRYIAYQSGPTSNSNSGTLNETTILGSDYDRVNKTNSKLWFLNGLDGYSSSGRYTAGGDSLFASFTTIKSGSIGYNSGGTPNTNNTSGLYIGGRSSTNVNSMTGAKVEGGKINNIIGGYGYNGTETTNSTFIGMSGGEVRQIYGGAGHSTTKGNRIICVTGGTVVYSVLGGSDSFSSNENDDGVLKGSTLIYVGGNAVIGDVDDPDSLLFGVEAGSVFGAGGGRNGATAKGTVYDSHVIINGGTIKNSVYGGGNYGSVGTQKDGAATSTIDILNGTMENVYGGSKSVGFSKNTYTASSTININVKGGTIGNVYGGSNINGVVYGSVNINVNNGTVSNNVYGGGKGGYQSNTNQGTYVTGNVNVVIGDGTSDSKPKVSGSVYGGSAFGTVNSNSRTADTSNYNTSVTVNSGTVLKSVFGGGMGGTEGNTTYSPNVAGDATTTINGGNIGNVFGGNDAESYVKGDVEVYLKGGTIGNVYGGGNSTGQPTPYVYEQGATVNNIFGGSNVSGTVNNSNVTVTSGNIGNVFGGNNAGGNTITTLVTVNGGTFRGDIYGGGFSAESTTTTVNVNTATVNDIYGGGQKAGATNTTVNTNGTTCDEIFGGSNISGVITNTATVNVRNTNGTAAYGAGNKANVNNSRVNLFTSTLDAVYGGGNKASATTGSIVNVNSGTYTSVYGGGNAAGDNASNSATVNYYNGTTTNLFGGSNASGNITTTTVNVGLGSSTVDNANMNIYGGNNAGGSVQTTNVNLNKVKCNNVYGGGNEAIVGRTNVITNTNTIVNNLFGGGNAAGVTKISEDSTIVPNTYVRINGSTVNGSLFGGGDEGIVSGSTDVFITNGTIKGNAYAGGNGASAIVYTNSTITIDGNSVIGTSSTTAPSGGCVFGSGNAASTGDDGENSNSTVNIAGGHIYGNVYGGAKMSTVYGVATLNIGYNSISNNSSLTKTNIKIDGSVYGGGESNESGSATYDWNAYSVMKGIDVNINGTGYTDFGVHGNIFGSGNASTSKGYSYIDIVNVGTATKPNTMLSIQRTDICTIDSSYVEVLGAIDITNELNDYEFSFNRINELIIKNNTTLLVQNNANLVKAFTSGYDDGNTFKKNSIDIDEDGNTSNLKTDNRLYTLSGINFNVNTNEQATEFGKVTGMTFFGMYKTDGNDYVYGLYDKSVNNGDTLGSDAQMYGGSYVQGLNYEGYDYTEDGFYSNFYTDDDPTKAIYVSYIDPKKMGENCNRWIIGKNLNVYKITLYASPFGSAGTEILSMADFSGSNVIFEVESFDSSQLNSGVSLLKKSDIPRIAASEADANSNFALSLKTESQEWTSIYTTNMLSASGGLYNGDDEYRTDNTNSVPKLNFYLYHSKNVTTTDELGKCNLYMTVYVPTTAIDYSIETVQIEISIKGRENNTEAYASAINYGKYYEVFSMGNVNITSTSQFSTYYSLTLFDKQFSDVYGATSYHALSTEKALPVGTMVTMIDFAQGTNPVTYYYEVDSTSYAAASAEVSTYGEVNYKLTDFKRMSSTNNNYMYDESTAQTAYYNPITKLVDEEFIFIFDFSKTDGTFIESDVPMLFNLYKEEGGITTTVANVYGSIAEQMIYSTYLNDNEILEEEITNYPTYVYHNSTNTINYGTKIGYDKTGSGVAIIDTNYNSSAMGVNIKIFDSSNNLVASNKLIGTYFTYNGQNFFADADGTFRIKLAGKVSELATKLVMVTDDTMDEGTYTMEYTLFASEDGLHNSDDRSVSETHTIIVISSKSSIVVDCDDEAKLIIGETGLNAAGDASNVYTVKVSSSLSNIQVMLEVLKRSTEDANTLAYDKVAFSSLFSNSFSANSNNEVPLGITTSGTNTITLNINEVENLTSGTYRLNFKLYDNGVLIDSEYKYVIVDKQVE